MNTGKSKRKRVTRDGKVSYIVDDEVVGASDENREGLQKPRTKQLEFVIVVLGLISAILTLCSTLIEVTTPSGEKESLFVVVIQEINQIIVNVFLGGDREQPGATPPESLIKTPAPTTSRSTPTLPGVSPTDSGRNGFVVPQMTATMTAAGQ